MERIKMKKNFLKSERGASAIEAAFIMPFLFLLYFSLQDLTALITFNRKITSTSATISDTVAQSSSTIVRSTVTDIFNSVSMIMQPTGAADVHVDVYGYRLNGAAVTQRWKATNGGAPVCPVPDTTNFSGMMSASNDLVVSVTCMNYTPFIATFLGTNLLGSTSFLLSQQITSRPRTSTTLDCVTASGSATLCTS